MTPMRVLVDALPLLGEASIATYLRELLQHVSAAGPANEYELFFRGFRAHTRALVARFRAEPAFARFPVRKTRVPDRVLEWCWTRRSLHVPFTEAWLGRPDIFLSTIYLTPVVHGPAVVMIAYDLIPFRFPQFYGRVDPLLEERTRRAIARSSAIIAISECTKRDFVDMMGADPARVHVIYPGVDARFRPAPDPDGCASVVRRYGIRPPYLLYVGSLGPHKNVSTLVRVFRRLKRERGLPHQLVLCGKAQWGPEVVAEARDLVAGGDAMILDFVDAADIPHLYHAAEAFTFLSLYEGFGLPPLEAMASGVPVVVSDAGSLPEVVGDAGLQVSPTDEEAIEAALYRVLTDGALRDDLRARGLARAARFSWSQAATQILKVFAEARATR